MLQISIVNHNPNSIYDYFRSRVGPLLMQIKGSFAILNFNDSNKNDQAFEKHRSATIDGIRIYLTRYVQEHVSFSSHLHPLHQKLNFLQSTVAANTPNDFQFKQAIDTFYRSVEDSLNVSRVKLKNHLISKKQKQGILWEQMEYVNIQKYANWNITPINLQSNSFKNNINQNIVLNTSLFATTQQHQSNSVVKLMSLSNQNPIQYLKTNSISHSIVQHKNMLFVGNENGSLNWFDLNSLSCKDKLGYQSNQITLSQGVSHPLHMNPVTQLISFGHLLLSAGGPTLKVWRVDQYEIVQDTNCVQFDIQATLHLPNPISILLSSNQSQPYQVFICTHDHLFSSNLAQVHPLLKCTANAICKTQDCIVIGSDENLSLFDARSCKIVQVYPVEEVSQIVSIADQMLYATKKGCLGLVDRRMGILQKNVNAHQSGIQKAIKVASNIVCGDKTGALSKWSIL